MKNEFEFFMSVGCNCRAAQALKRNLLRIAASPLNWMSGYSLETVPHLFQTGFEDYFLQIEERTTAVRADNNRYIIDQKNQITSVHHFPKSQPLCESQENFRKKMRERYLRIDKIIKESEEVCLVSNWNDPYDRLIAFLKSFGLIYPQTTFLLLNVRNSEEDTQKIYQKRIDQRLRITEYIFHDEGLTKSWEGNTKRWDEILNQYTLKHVPALGIAKDQFYSGLKEANSEKRPIMIFGAGFYGKILMQRLADRHIEVFTFLTTAPDGNASEIEGVPVKRIEDMPMTSRAGIVIIAVEAPEAQREITNRLVQSGFQNIIAFQNSPLVIGKLNGDEA